MWNKKPRVRKVREKEIEKYLRTETKRRLGGTARKYNSPARVAEPDRILTWSGLCVFVEAKRPGEKPTQRQLEAHEDLQADGQLVFVVDTKPAVDALLDALELL